MDLTPDDDGATRVARADELITVRLPENPTTGYRWQPDVDPASLVLTDDRYEGPTQPIGAGGRRVLTFRAARPGSTRLRLVRRRSWEQTAVEDFAVDLDVRPQ